MAQKCYIGSINSTVKCNEQDRTNRITAYRKPPVVEDGSKARSSLSPASSTCERPSGFVIGAGAPRYRSVLSALAGSA